MANVQNQMLEQIFFMLILDCRLVGNGNQMNQAIVKHSVYKMLEQNPHNLLCRTEIF